MAFVERAMVLLMVMASLQISMSVVYKVGDSSGWTTIGNVDYKKWAASKTFHIGDIISFQYNKQFHNVMQVSHTDYDTCKTSSPIVTYTTGNDSITIKKSGHYYFLCGIPGHCQAGQKVDIRIPKVQSSTAPALAPTSPSASPPSFAPVPLSPTPSKNSASRPSKGFICVVAFALAIFAGFGY